MSVENFKSMNDFCDYVGQVMRTRRMSRHTEKSYLLYIRRFIRFHHRRPEHMGEEEVALFLSHMARQNVAASTQNVAFNALIFLYRHVLGLQARTPGCARSPGRSRWRSWTVRWRAWQPTP